MGIGADQKHALFTLDKFGSPKKAQKGKKEWIWAHTCKRNRGRNMAARFGFIKEENGEVSSISPLLVPANTILTVDSEPDEEKFN
ncbi:MAG: hypothetical protein IPG53_23815 [Ignavibacteriales bacterium]|nr:hypothetical protein [Ignavibacteriales bacterium]